MTRSELISMLRRHEGVEPFGYQCSEGKLTVGVGRNIDPEGGLGLSPDEIDYLLENDIDRTIADLSRFEFFQDLTKKPALLISTLTLVALLSESLRT